MSIFTYLFWPNPGNATYTSPTMLTLLIVGVALVVGSFALRYWRKNLSDKIMHRLSKSWPTASLWFGIVLLFLVMSRVESIQFVAMRFWIIVWGLVLLLYAGLQLRLFRMRYYQVVPTVHAADSRDKYLPKAKKHR